MDSMLRVNRNRPCPVCGRSDWCLVCDDGNAAICARIEEGSIRRCGNAGWLHLRDNVPYMPNVHRKRLCRRRIARRTPPLKSFGHDFAALAERYVNQIVESRLTDLSTTLGVSTGSLRRLRVGWDGRAYSFPMSNACRETIGIRRRFPSGGKAAVKGSQTGLFIPLDLTTVGPLLIVEGESDLAASLDLGFSAIGRPNCTAMVRMTAEFARLYRDVVVVGDNDEPNEHGWYLFQSRKSEINDIKFYLERHLELELQNFSFEDLSVADRRHHALLKEAVNRKGREYIAANFGLDITITDFNRKRTLIEIEETDEKIGLLRDMRKEQNAATLNAHQAMNAQLAELRRERLKLITMGDEEELEEIDQKIRTIEKQLPQITEKSLKKDLFLSPSKKSKTPGLKEIAEKASDQELENLKKLLTEKKEYDSD